MMEPIKFFAQGLPKGQPRPKAFCRHGGRAGVYDPATAEGWKAQVAVAAKEFLPSQPIDSPVYLWLEFYFPRPKGHYGSGRNKGQLKASAPGYQTSKPDSDNAAKAIMDALTTLQMWKDDAQVCHLIVRKLYDDGRGPGCLITIKEAL